MTRSTVPFLVPALLAWLCLAGTASGLINPKFTPVHLTKQSASIWVLKLSAPKEKNEVHADVMQALKGRKPNGRLVIDLSAAPRKAWAKRVKEQAATRGDRPALMFAGEYQREEDEPAAKAAFLHIDRTWVRLERGKGDTWQMVGTDIAMLGTWDGCTETLAGAVRYVLTDPNPVVPVAVGWKWGDRKTIARVKGKVHEARAVDLAGDGKLCLFLACEKGDRLFRYDQKAKAFKHVTATNALKSASRVTAWGDFNGDGRLDLASWDGKALRLWHQAADGKSSAGRTLAVKFLGACASLSVVDVGVAGRPGLLVGATDGSPVLLRPAKSGAKAGFQVQPLGPMTPRGVGLAGPCLVADFDNDGHADLLRLFSFGSTLYPGKGGGRFGKPRALKIALGKGRSGAFLGDYDHDGRFDVFCVAEDRCRLWQNRGKLKFDETLGLSGEISYTAQDGGIAGATCDINNDGRQDVMIAYADKPVEIYFNRGFRSLGKALELIWKDEIQQATKDGQQAATVADLNGDGAQDLALVLRDGSVRVLLRETWEDESPLAAEAVLPLRSGTAGPIRVGAWFNKRFLGAWNVEAGAPGAFFGVEEAGPVTLEWTFPGEKTQRRKVVLEDKPVRMLLPGGE